MTLCYNHRRSRLCDNRRVRMFSIVVKDMYEVSQFMWTLLNTNWLIPFLNFFQWVVYCFDYFFRNIWKTYFPLQILLFNSVFTLFCLLFIPFNVIVELHKCMTPEIFPIVSPQKGNRFLWTCSFEPYQGCTYIHL